MLLLSLSYECRELFDWCPIYDITILHECRCSEHPCFGARTGLTSEEWWYRVIEQTYLTTRDIGEVEAEEVRRLMPELFEILYSNVFNSKEGWILKEDVEYTLIKLAEWRDMGAGPKVGVLSNFDDRLHKILKGTRC